ncbi:hypothetical protein QW131_10555 [Roseibium salinum]|nr:hypothetical protein [Roseibium salinum]
MSEKGLERPAPGAPDFRIEEHESVSSTNNLCFERARSGHAGGLWIRAQMQTEGRGRRGRDWQSPRGQSVCQSAADRPATGRQNRRTAACCRCCAVGSR